MILDHEVLPPQSTSPSTNLIPGNRQPQNLLIQREYEVRSTAEYFIFWREERRLGRIYYTSIYTAVLVTAAMVWYSKQVRVYYSVRT